MPNSDIVFTNVEVVQPDKDQTVLLGVSTAVQPASVPQSNGVWVGRPWTWTGINSTPAKPVPIGWTVLGRKEAVPPVAWTVIPSGAVTVRSIPTDPNEAAWGPVIDALKNSMDEIAASLPHGSDPTSSQEINIDNNSFQGDPTTDIPVSQKWASLLLNLASAPFPIPEKLQLTSFLEIGGSTQYDQFLALPSFSAGKDYDPSTQLPSTQTPPDFWQIPDVSGIAMRSEFSHPLMGNLLPDDTLWLSPAHDADDSPLVANWQAHLYELLGPYLDTAHLLTSAVFDPKYSQDLANALKTLADWTPFSSCILEGLYLLITGPGSVAQYDAKQWAATLLTNLNLTPATPALDPAAPPWKSLDQPMADLRRIVAAASTGGTLAKLVNSQKNSVPANYMLAENAPALLSFLQTRLAMAYTSNIVTAAKSLPAVADPSMPDIMTAVLQSLVQTVLRPNLLSLLNATFPAGSPLPAALGAICYPDFDPSVTNLTADFRKALFTLALGTAQPGTAPALTANAPPLVLPAVSPRAADKASVDPLRGIRGVSVLLRRTDKDPKKSTAWTCPGVVAPVTGALGKQVAHTDLPLLVATRLFYDRDLLTGSMLYNNGPFACANLLHEYMDPENRLYHLKPSDPNAPPGTPDPSAIPFSPLQYVSYEGGGRLAAGTAALWAGFSYEFVTFAITNSGAVPQKLRDQYPSRLKIVDTLPAGVNSSNVRYFRTVPVAGLDTCDANGERLRSQSVPFHAPLFPAIPDNVWPRATDTKTPGAGVGIANVPQVEGPHLPLLLLTPPDPLYKPANQTSPRLTFSLRLPSVDPQTWLTTAGYNNQQADVVLDKAYLYLQQQQQAPITDPLVISVDFVFYKWTNPGWTAASAPVSYTAAELLNQDPRAMPGVETLPIVISVNTLIDKDHPDWVNFSALNFDSSKILSRIPNKVDGSSKFTFENGAAYLLEARLTLNLNSPNGVSMMPGYAPGHATPTPGAPPPQPGAPTPPPCIVGYQLLIEVASTLMPTDLMKPLSLTTVPLGGLPDQQVQFNMAANADGWQNVHRVDFLRQMWKWTGRTQPVVGTTTQPGDLLTPQYFPTNPSSSQAKAVAVAWELIEFGERPTADHIESRSTYNSATSSYSFTLDLSLDSRATYLRVAPRIYSRYQGLYADSSWSVVSSIDIPDKAAWATAFVRSRTKALKMPRLKALLPLTESAFSPGTPGILAVFDGPAYDQAGLAERLTVSFATIADPDLSGKMWTQAGPDPLAGSHKALVTPDQQHIPSALLAIGPIGHTSDPLSGLDHKFLSHSYIIRPDPSSGPDAIQDFSWWFASLTFQLKTDIPSSVFAQTTQSEIAYGSWIQFLPGFQSSTHQADRFDQWTFSVDTSTASPDGSGGQTFTLHDKSGLDQAPGTIGLHTSHLTSFLMVNRVVLDIAGVPREDYFGIAMDSGKGYRLLSGSIWKPGINARVRVIETRQGIPTNFTNHVEFWQCIIGKNSATPPEAAPDDEHRSVPVNLSSPIKARTGN